MKLARKVGTAVVFSLFGAVLWLGCTDDEQPSATKDGGGGGSNKDVTTTGDGTTGNPEGGGNEGGGPQGISCQNYCAAIAANCTGANQQYPSNQACLATCNNNRMLAGAAGETNTATLACRQYHALVAATDQATHCPHAGPSGGGQCGSRCEAFCRFASDPQVGFCKYVAPPDGGVDAGGDADPDAEAGVVDAGPGLGYTPPYTSVAECLTACAAFPVVTAGEAYNNSDSKNNFNCRMYHLVNGIGLGNQNGKVHCDHIGVSSPTCNQ